MTRMMELINGAASQGDGEENIASFARWCPASAAQFAG